VRGRLPWGSITLVVLGVALLAYIGVVSEQRQRAAVDTYSTYDARSGGYRAWYELLEREGVDVTRFERQAAFLDDSIQTLIVSIPLPSDETAILPTAVDRAAIDRWIGDGGTVVVLGPYVPDVDSPLAHVRFRALAAAALHRLGVRAVASAEHPVVRRGTYRRGTIYLVGDEALFSNARIARADDARLAFALAAPRGGGTVAFDETIHGDLVPEHWWLVAPRRLVIAIIVAVLVVALAALGASIRLGPPLRAPVRREASSLEYVEAVASLYGRARAVRPALHEALQSVKRAVGTSLGLPGDMPTRELALGTPIADLRGALAELDVLATMPAPNERHLVRGIRLAHLLRKEFETHGSGF
jgi:hypothetical protein